MGTEKQDDLCPKCGDATRVKAKKLLIARESPALRFPNLDERAGYRRLDQLAVDECEPESLAEPPWRQFVDGFYCERCGVGFVAEAIRKQR